MSKKPILAHIFLNKVYLCFYSLVDLFNLLIFFVSRGPALSSFSSLFLSLFFRDLSQTLYPVGELSVTVFTPCSFSYVREASQSGFQLAFLAIISKGNLFRMPPGCGGLCREKSFRAKYPYQEFLLSDLRFDYC